MKNTIIIILSLLVIGLGSFLIFDKVLNKEESKTIESNNPATDNQTIQEVTQTESKCESKIDSKYVGTYVGEKGKDKIVINEDGTYNFTRTSSVETKASSGLVVTNGVYLALVEVFDKYDESNWSAPAPVTYYFIVNGNTLKSLNQSASESPVFNKQ